MRPDYVSPCGTVTLYRGDCLAVLPTLEAGSVDAVVTDPPYGIGADRRQENRANKQHGAAMAQSKSYGASAWDDSRPSADVFAAIRAVSQEQVIFGGNYFADLLPPSSSWLAWDKDNGTNGYADFELAWTSHKRAARKVRWRWHGMLQEPGPKDERVHPTQKPVGLMRWVLENYTEADSIILDPFMGSGTTAVACIQTGRRFIGVELEPRYFDIAVKRVEKALAEKSERLQYAGATP